VASLDATVHVEERATWMDGGQISIQAKLNKEARVGRGASGLTAKVNRTQSKIP
jgi:hypothetical protein